MSLTTCENALGVGEKGGFLTSSESVGAHMCMSE